MPRLSLYRPTPTSDYKFFDRTIKEMVFVGGTDVNIHKYLGPESNANPDALQPNYINASEKNIQDLLFLENRDRKYDLDVYTMRGVYSIQDLDFDLSQFGLFLANDTIFMVFHYNEMVERIGRKLMSGDVIELPHLKDYHPLDDDIPVALKRYYVIQDASRASEGYSPTWHAHLWRVKCTPLVDSQEFKQILKFIKQNENDEDSSPIRDILSEINKREDINDFILDQAAVDVPKSGYDTTTLYVEPTKDQKAKEIARSDDLLEPTDVPTMDVKGYLTGDGLAPNGHPVISGVNFPNNPTEGMMVLRLDYFPNRLFRYHNNRWIKVEDSVRNDLTPGRNNKSLKSGFINNQETTKTKSGKTVKQKQSLHNALKIEEDE